MYSGDELYSDDITSGETYDAITGEVWTCPQCGSTTGWPVAWDYGTDPETGYHDAGEGCTECSPGVGR